MSPNADPPPTATPWELQTWTSHRKCPTCGVPLFGARQDNFRIDACGTCGGAWLPLEEAQRMLKARSSTPGQLAEKAAKAAPNLQLIAEGRPCPDCSTPLERHHVYPCDVDTCKAHGTWFDAFELRAVAEATIRRDQQHESAALNGAIAQVAAAAQGRENAVLIAGAVLGVMRVGARAGRF